jgi:CBS domain-containing protein
MGLAARDVMQPAVRTVRPDMSLADLERSLSETGDSGCPVVSGAGRLVGVVSRSDILRKLTVEQSYAEYEADYYSDLAISGASQPTADIAAEVGRRLGGVCVQDVMSTSPITVQESTPVAEVARVLVERRIHRLPVVDSGALVGIVTTSDLVRAVADGRLG